MTSAETTPPSRAAVLSALWGLRRSVPFDDAAVEQRYALLHLPFLASVPFDRRPGAFRDALLAGIERLSPPDRTLAQQSWFGTKGNINVRRAAALRELRSAYPDWAEEFADEALERRTANRLVAILQSAHFQSHMASRLPRAPLPATTAVDELGYRFLLMKVGLRIDSSNIELQTWDYKFTVQAMRNNVRVFFYDYQWTGSDVQEHKPILTGTDRHQRHLGVHPEVQGGGTWNVHIVHFGRRVSIGEVVDVEFSMKVQDHDRAFRSFVGFYAPSSGVPTMEFECHLPDVEGLDAHASEWDISSGVPRETPLHALQPDEAGVFRHTVQSPRSGSAHGISWVDLYRLAGA